MAAPPTSCTKSSTHVYKVRNHRESLTSKLIFFRGHRWELTAWCHRDDDYVVFRVTAFPHGYRLGKYPETIFKAKISIEILDRSGKPVAMENPLVVERQIKARGHGEPLFFDFVPPGMEGWYLVRKETICIRRSQPEMSSCVHNDGFAFRCTVSEDDVPLGTFSKLRSRVSGIFSKHQPARVCPINEDF